MIQNSVSFRFPDAAYNFRMNSPVKFWPIRAYYNIDLSRAKSEALGSQISIVYSNKMENRVMLSKEATKCQKKKISGSNKQKNNFERAAHFFVHFFAVFLHDYNKKLPETC